MIIICSKSCLANFLVDSLAKVLGPLDTVDVSPGLYNQIVKLKDTIKDQYGKVILSKLSNLEDQLEQEFQRAAIIVEEETAAAKTVPIIDSNNDKTQISSKQQRMAWMIE